MLAKESAVRCSTCSPLERQLNRLNMHRTTSITQSAGNGPRSEAGTSRAEARKATKPTYISTGREDSLARDWVMVAEDSRSGGQLADPRAGAGYSRVLSCS